MRVALAFLAILAVAAAVPEQRAGSRIVGGTVTTINQYPFGASMLFSQTQSNFRQSCGGSILTQRSILTAAHCFWYTGMIASRWQVRLGSSLANSGGTVHLSSQIINHPSYNPSTEDNDFSVLRLASLINYIPGVVAQAGISGVNYALADNSVVWAIGWGAVQVNGPSSEQLRHVQVWTVNQAVCRQRYATRGYLITDNMLCSGWLDVGGRDQCQGDSGGPLVHNNVVVGVCSWGIGCADSFFPGVNARVSRAAQWLNATG